MNFRSFMKERKIKKQLPKGLEHCNISSVILSTPSNYLENFVIDHFDSILKNSDSYEYHRFNKFPSWKKMFVEKSTMIFEMQENFCDFENIIYAFPELEADVYTYLLNDIINSKPGDELHDQICIAEDLLIPMAHMENYCGVFFPQIRKFYKEIIDTTTTIHDFYAVVAALEIYFDIPTEELNEIIDNYIKDEINLWLSQKVDTGDFCSLLYFFYSSNAYDTFMKKLYDIFAMQGLDLYKFLIEEIGTKAEILEYEYDCYQFHNQ